ncbi:hypothetical protein N7509_012030 [Penicillium cosmopolitanum]|uniref:Uncharacterized protein n=1 Tax=Penicillium cosmopolitanum TaxID=1131564 RepID=A0A9W9VGV5_9EURO|nr:uncharacterized protein N7509_012030 [Penicillium cosmopolitanum]KAJ5378911.1 hypothetical protein N7509_012030 [Penicillium cosmopolitanum]
MNSSQKKASSSAFHCRSQWTRGVVQELISRHHDINEPDGNSTTPLMQACRNGHIHVATFLINHGADVSARNSSGYTALYMAAEIGSLELVQLLMGKGATVDEQNPVTWPMRVAKTPDIRRVLTLPLASPMTSPPTSRFPGNRDRNRNRNRNRAGGDPRDPMNRRRSLGVEDGFIRIIEESWARENEGKMWMD